MNKEVFEPDVVSKINNDWLWNFGRWLTDEDEYSDTIISSRIRLARNVQGFAFPNVATKNELTHLLEKVRSACFKCPTLDKSTYLELDQFSTWDRKYFVERRLASPQFIENEVPSMLVVGPAESLSIMVNEEDHLRIQCLQPGLGISEAWKRVSKIDDELEENLTFCYSNQFGYLTSCPTNIGTGMRVSTFVHLPALSIADKINVVMKKLPTSEIAIRGFYGEGSESIGSIFQISNQLTLGRTETSVIDRMIGTAKQLVDLERKTRAKLLSNNRIKIEDEVCRAMGILTTARIISSLESMDLLSTLRLGSATGLTKGLSVLAVDQLMVLVQPAHLQKIYDRVLKTEERDILRADFLRQNLHV